MAKTTEEIVEEIAQQYLAERRDHFYEHFYDMCHSYEDWTPIEQMMARGLQFALWSRDHFEGEGGDNTFSFAPHVKPFDAADLAWGEPYGVTIYPQMKVGKYTADFLVALKHYRGGEVMGVIECDGHDYHERTKSQAQHDKQRDRHFQSLGLIVLRYTGSEIYKDPIKCATDALKLLFERADQITRRPK